jgi:ribosome-binding protein aMBF1 (putative translation factor)
LRIALAFFALFCEYAAMLIDQSLDRIRAYKKAMGWSVLRLATEAGVWENTLRKMDDPDWAPNTSTVRKLEGIIPASFDPSATPSQAAE